MRAEPVSHTYAALLAEQSGMLKEMPKYNLAWLDVDNGTGISAQNDPGPNGSNGGFAEIPLEPRRFLQLSVLDGSTRWRSTIRR